MNLDINTEKGQETLVYEQKLIDIVHRYKEGIEIKPTDKKGIAVVDGIIYNNGELLGVSEHKCRNLTLKELKELKTWLITYEKLKKARFISKLLHCHLYGLVYLVPDNLVLKWHIANRKGEFLFDFNVYYSETKRSVNGGRIHRFNAYLPVKHAEIINL